MERTRLALASLALGVPTGGLELMPDPEHRQSGVLLEMLEDWHEGADKSRIGLQRIYDLAGYARIIGTPDLIARARAAGALAFLQGISPDLYEPLTSALRSVGDRACEAAENALRDATHWPDDLPLTGSARFETAPLIVAWADKLGVLGLLAESLGSEAEAAMDVARMHRMIRSLFLPDPE